MKKNFKYLFMFLAIITGTLVMSSCSKDDDDKNDKHSTEETATSSLVGTWRCVESEGDYKFESTITFYSNGKFSANSSESGPWGNYSSEDSGTYMYSEKTNKLTLTYTYSSDGDLGTDTGTLIWEGTSTIYVKDADGEINGPYKKIK